MKKSVALLFIMAAGALALGLAIGRARANPGELDPTWGDGGVSRYAFSENGDWVTAALLDPDGKVVISGWVDGYPGAFGVARFRPDGTSDTTFGEEGKVITRFSTDPELPNSSWSIGPRPGGGYLVAGEICDADYVICEWVAAAYNHDGTLDETFDDDGWITTTVPGAEGVYAWPPTNLLQPDGKSIVGGIVFDSEGDIDFALRRYNSDGSLDDTFGDGGIAVHDLSDKGDYVEYLSLLPDGKILVLGGMGAVIDPFLYEGEGGFLARLNDDGSIDDTFGTDGVVTWGDDGVFTAAEGLAVSADGEIYVSGQRGEGADGTFDCAVWHFDAGGAMDETFGDGGLLLIDDGGDEWCATVNFLPDGKLALTGNIYPLEAERSSAGRIRERGAMGSRSSLGGDSPKVGTTPDALVIRLNPDGTLDETFGDGGLLNHDVEEKDNDGTIAVIQPDGKILIAANVYDVETEYQDIAISRFLGDGPAARVMLPVIVGGQAGTAVNLEDAAIQAVARQQGIPAARLAIANSAVAQYPVSGVTAHAFKVEDTATGELFGVTVDAGGAVLDEAALDAAEVAAYRARYGVYEPELYELLASGTLTENTKVIIWLKEPEYQAPERPQTDDRSPMSEAEIDAMFAEVDARRSAFVEQVTAPVVSRLEGMGLEVSSDAFAPVVYGTLSSDSLLSLREWNEIDMIYLDRMNEAELNVARSAINAQTVHGRGITGSGVRVGVLEIGGRAAPNPNMAFTQDNTYSCIKTATGEYQHATAVAGIIRSSHSTLRGIAPASTLLVTGACTGDFGLLQNRATYAIDWGARVVNMSWGLDIGTTPGAQDRFYDNLVFTRWRTVVKSAGNRGESTANITTPGMGYNVLAVGAFDDRNTTSWTGDVMGSYSSWRDPVSTYQDRDKPEIAAPGSTITSLSMASPWNNYTASGTSFAAPMVTGTTALLLQRNSGLVSWPEAVRAILMATAWHNIEGNTRLSEKDGAGAIMADRADDVARRVNGNWGTQTYNCNSTNPLVLTSMNLTYGRKYRFVIVWATPTSHSTYPSRPSADLDLRLINSAGNTLASSLSYDNTFEIIEYTHTQASGTYRMRVNRVGCTVNPSYLAWAWSIY